MCFHTPLILVPPPFQIFISSITLPSSCLNLSAPRSPQFVCQNLGKAICFHVNCPIIVGKSFLIVPQ